ncbi:MAG: hypothetical protein KDI06_09820 [Calditrichaeota bacterium]|nr:hypothetical protein [Calditrichota bacterium]
MGTWYRFFGIFLLIFWGTAALRAGDEPTLKVIAWTQAVATRTGDDPAFSFGMDRVRVMGIGDLGERAWYRLHVDFIKQKNDLDVDGDTPGIIKDAEVRYRFSPHLDLTLGKFKTPVGMEFAISGYKLHFVKRGLGQTLVFERNAGAMLRANLPTLPGLQLLGGIFNPGSQKRQRNRPQRQGLYLCGRLALTRTAWISTAAIFTSRPNALLPGTGWPISNTKNWTSRPMPWITRTPPSGWDI